MFKKIFQSSVVINFTTAVNNRSLCTTLQKFKSIKKLLDYSKVPKLNQDDLEFQYVRGWGPGGQSTNKTNNAVVLKHLPTGIVVKCHETRSQTKNKEIAEQLMISRLDLHFNGEESVENQEKKIMNKVSLEKKRRQKKTAALKQAFKEREGLE